MVCNDDRTPITATMTSPKTYDSSPRPSLSSMTQSGRTDNYSGSTLQTPQNGSAKKPPRPSPRRSVEHHRQYRSPIGPTSRSVVPSPASSAPRGVGNRITRREYRLLQSQTLLLAGTASLGFVLFLLFALPIPALVVLTVSVTSMGACLLVATSAAKTWYELQLEHPLGLVRHLPQTARAYLTQKSLNEVLCPSASMESLPSLLSSVPSRNNSSPSLSRNNSTSVESLSSPSLSPHISSSRWSSSSLPRECQYQQRKIDERVQIGGVVRPPQSNDACRSRRGHAKDP